MEAREIDYKTRAAHPLYRQAVLNVLKTKGLGFMSISKEQALAAFHERYPQGTVHSVEITDSLPDRCAVYNRPASCWFVLFLEEKLITRLRSSRLVAVSKSTGKIVYDGDANDRG